MNPLKKIEAVQYKTSLVITGAIRGTFRECLYRQIGLEFLSDSR